VFTEYELCVIDILCIQRQAKELERNAELGITHVPSKHTDKYIETLAKIRQKIADSNHNIFGAQEEVFKHLLKHAKHQAEILQNDAGGMFYFEKFIGECKEIGLISSEQQLEIQRTLV
jgi:hypothetical protein